MEIVMPKMRKFRLIRLGSARRLTKGGPIGFQTEDLVRPYFG